MQTPDKIIAALRCCADGQVPCNKMCVYDNVILHFKRQMMADAAHLIESLSAELEQAKRERDAAKHDLIPSCAICAHNRGLKKWDDECNDCYDKSKWQWRGVNGKGEQQNDI